MECMRMNEKESLLEYILKGVSINRDGTERRQGCIIAGEAIAHRLKNAIEEIERIRLAEVNCDADEMRDKILEILRGTQSKTG